MRKLFILAILTLALGWAAIGGGLALASVTLVVDDDLACSGAVYSTISAAVTAAGAGDTIQVCAGTYNETVTIGAGLDNLTLQGDDPATTFITGGILFQTAVDLTGVTVKNFTVTGQSGFGAFSQGGTGYLYDLTFDNLILDGQNSVGFAMYLGKAAGSFTVTNSEVTGYTDWGNIYIGEVTAFAGLGGPSFTTVTFEGNYIHDNVGSNVVYGNGDNYTDTFLIRDNVFENNGVWASIEPRNATKVIVENNLFTGQAGGWPGSAGLYFTQDGGGLVDALVTGNEFSNNVAGITVYSGDVSGLEIHFNDFFGNATAVWLRSYPSPNPDWPEITGDANAQCNWWGDVTGSLDVLDTDGLGQLNPGGLGDPVDEHVLYDPWLAAQMPSPCEGFVTGSGWIMSPAGAYTADPLLEGKATFGFSSRYKKGANVPTGNTQFNFQVADLNFHSDSYDWLVVTGAGEKAMCKGTGTVNGADNYGFMLTAIDGDDGDPDRFRIKIWDKTTDDVIYDNGVSGPDGTVLGGGRIVIHEK